MTSRRLLTIGVAALLACQTATLLADGPTTLDALLALPPSPGVEVMLLPHAADPRVQLRWRQALSDQDADRRAAAARMLGIAGVRTGVGGLLAGVNKEQDAVARAEMLRALVVVGSDVTDKIILQRIDQLPELVGTRLVRTLATVRPAAVTTFLLEGGELGSPRTRAAGRAATMLGRLVKVAPAEVARLDAEADRLGPGALQGILHMTHSTSRRVDTPLLVAGLRRNVYTAGEVMAYLPAVHSRPLNADAPLSKAYAAWRSAQPAGSDANHELLLALADRWLQRTPAAPLPTEGVDPATVTGLQLPPPAFAVLSKDERRTLVRRLELKGDEAEAIENARFLVRDRRFPWENDTPTPVLLADLPGAVLADLVRLTGCQAKVAHETDRALTTKYRPDGRPLSIVLGGTELDGSCERLAQLIASTSYGTPTVAGDDAGRALLRLLPEFVACQTDRDADARRPQGAPAPDDDDVAAPRKIKDQKPSYPLALRGTTLRGNTEAAVTINALVTSTGCVADAIVVRSVPLLDLPALQAIASWLYEPAAAPSLTNRWVQETINFDWQR